MLQVACEHQAIFNGAHAYCLLNAPYQGMMLGDQPLPPPQRHATNGIALLAWRSGLQYAKVVDISRIGSQSMKSDDGRVVSVVPCSRLSSLLSYER